MYKTCMYCQKDLGTNEVVEEFQVGPPPGLRRGQGASLGRVPEL